MSGSPFLNPASPPQDILPSALGNVLNRTRTLEAVVPPIFTPSRPYAFGTGATAAIAPAATPTSVTLTPFDSLYFDPTVFSGDTMNDLFLDKEGVYLLTVALSVTSSLGATTDTFSGPIYSSLVVAAGGGTGSDESSAYADNTGVTNLWSVGNTSQWFVTTIDIPALVSLTFGHNCVNTGPHAGVGTPINVDVGWTMMVTYLDGFSPDEP